MKMMRLICLLIHIIQKIKEVGQLQVYLKFENIILVKNTSTCTLKLKKNDEKLLIGTS